ncbi:MAG TPA: VRR-NUC domain-containing protein [Candidatus Dormibacteraeota bacterium]|jgi:hypothetical protein
MIAAPPVSERDFMGQVMELAALLGWRRAHFRPARTAHGWVTPVSGDGAGFPDLLLVRSRDGRAIAAELKAGTAKPTPAQEAWLGDLAACGLEVHVWRPTDWDAVVEALR